MALSPPLTLDQIYDTVKVHGTQWSQGSPRAARYVPGIRYPITIREHLDSPVSRGAGNLVRYITKHIIVVDVDNQILAASLGFQTPRDNTKVFLECNNQTPDEFQANYRPFVIAGREFMILDLADGFVDTIRPIMIIKPPWATDDGIIPGTKIFRLQPAGNINKYITTQINQPEYNASIDAHDLPNSSQCNQRVPTPVYELVPMTVQEFNNIPNKIVLKGGKTKRRNKKNRKSRKK
jgi:hypothetical protein